MSESAAALRALACQCRELATGASLDKVAASLSHIADDYERQADRAEQAEARTRRLLAEPPRPPAE